MAIWIQPREISDADGKPTGLFRLTAKSDEDDSGPVGLCSCDHDSPEDAANCPEARTKAERM